jgi:asparagine synthetase B (glutamine-hydrolysing)
MCGLAGVLASQMPRDDSELRAIGNLFTKLLVASEHRGPFATGVALVKSSGDHYIYKAPI